MVEFEEVYLDTSVVVARTLAQNGALTAIRWRKAISSELIVAELLRTLDRLRFKPGTPASELARLREDAEKNLSEIELIPVGTILLRRAGGSFPVPVKPLDAIHLATALVWAEHSNSMAFLTHDRQLATAARACGLRVYPEINHSNPV